MFSTEQYQTLGLEVTDIPTERLTEPLQNATKCLCFSSAGKSHRAGVPHPGSSVAGVRTRETLLDKAKGSALGVFQGGRGPGPNTLLVQLSPALFMLPRKSCSWWHKKAGASVTASCGEAKEGQYLWMHKNIPQQLWQLREGFPHQHQSFAPLPSFAARIPKLFPRWGIITKNLIHTSQHYTSPPYYLAEHHAAQACK